jgi:hypothetical protein
MITRRDVLASLLAPLAQGRRTPTRLSVSSNRRYLQDASGTPLFLVGDCPQNMPLKLAISELDNFMADCEAKGFNVLWICMDGQESGGLATKPPIDRNHNLMMKSGWDIATLNEPYFVTIDAIADAAKRYGIYCMFTPLSECQWHRDKVLANSVDNWYRYGTFIGKRYKDHPNIIWQIGNDNITIEAQHAVVRGIKDAGDTHLMTVNWRPSFHHEGSGWTRKYKYGEGWIDLNAWYINTPIKEGGAPCYWQKIEYERPNLMPTFATEVHYQQPYAKATDLDCRMQNYYVALGGGCGGHVYGSGFLANEWDYNTYKNNGGRLQAIHFKNLFVGREWTSLVPDYGHRFITGGFGDLSPSTTNYVSAAINNGSLAMAYCPKASTIAADMSTINGLVEGRWYDPTNGTWKPIPGSPFENRGARSFFTPGSNSAGAADWVLVFETKKTDRARGN